MFSYFFYRSQLSLYDSKTTNENFPIMTTHLDRQFISTNSGVSGEFRAKIILLNSMTQFSCYGRLDENIENTKSNFENARYARIYSLTNLIFYFTIATDEPCSFIRPNINIIKDVLKSTFKYTSIMSILQSAK